MKNLIAKLSESLSNGDFLLSTIIMILIFIANSKTIVKFLENRKKARVTNLIEALKCDHITGLTKSHLEEELAAEHFKLSTGIRLEKEFREELIKAYHDANGQVRFDHYKRALPHMTYIDNILSVRVTWFDKIGVCINGFCGLALAIISFLIMCLSFFEKGVPLIQFLGRLGVGSIYMGIAVFLFYQVLPVISAWHVAGALAKCKNKEEEIESTIHKYKSI